MTVAALVLADAPSADVKVVGLTLAERARRVALKAGATTALVARDRAAIADVVARGWLRSAAGDPRHRPAGAHAAGRAADRQRQHARRGGGAGRRGRDRRRRGRYGRRADRPRRRRAG
jgi:hypothetical protein